ncbi:PQQ-dependent sugar dehydrogenase [Catenovulum sp. 2E275]|uniref:PQQ-dependent sugar dehydrogenase n=1 Tax=Catenovulum sp. 2E275 TaxID=2980497 RepID=UPI0021CF41FC|nr:PQQ-dependent sugar dehydrogenase [Catenovulum sp. 2E275]MCU4675605.1 PQQ-dependent sugar dehydrogenase [Catenovulum sp. 2E275]
MKYLSFILFCSSWSGAVFSAPPNGEQVYQQYCAGCHGPQLQGGLGANLIDDVWLHEDSEQAIIETIRNGVIDKGMPAFKTGLTQEQIKQVAQFIKVSKSANTTPEVFLDKNQIFTTKHYQFNLKLINVFDSLIWAITFINANEYLATERDTGNLYYGNIDGSYRIITGTPKVWNNDQGGLLDVALDINFANNQIIYLAYAKENINSTWQQAQGMTAIFKARIEGNKLVDQQDIFSVDDTFALPSGRHFGSRLVADNNYLYFSIGERGIRPDAQDLTKPNGKIHRIHLDGSIPSDNPFVNQASAYKSIWTYGNRNPQGLARHPNTGELWSTEHGPKGGDEINLISKGLNYGWPVITYGMNYDGTSMTNKTHMPGMEQPIRYYVPSIATSGIDFYNGDKWSKWQNNMFVTGMSAQELRRVKIVNKQVVEEELLVKNFGRVRDVAVSPSGDIYIMITRDHKGHMYKLEKLNKSGNNQQEIP